MRYKNNDIIAVEISITDLENKMITAEVITIVKIIKLSFMFLRNAAKIFILPKIETQLFDLNKNLGIRQKRKNGG